MALAEGPKTSNQIRGIIGLSREHTGRLMKQLFTRGLVLRNDENKPYLYEITEPGRRYLANSA
jgi:predicted transcriptional regulator